MRVLKLQGADNARDLGGIPLGGSRMVARGLVYRGGALHGITDHDRRVLFDEHGITCVIDLRCGWEREDKPDPEVPGVENLHIPFYDLEVVGIEYTEPAEGTKVVGRDVACDPNRFYRSLANPLTVGQMAQAAHEIFDRATAGRPVYVHCSGGKDRAGIMSLVVLSILGASRDDILDDYLLTNVDRDRNYDKTFARFMRLSGDEERARKLVESHRALPENISAFYEEIEARYGNMDEFIRNQLTIPDAQRARFQAACSCSQAE